MLDKNLTFLLLFVVLGSLQTTLLHDFENVQPMFRVVRDGQYLFQVLLPQSSEDCVVLQGSEEEGGDFVKESYHFVEVNSVLFLLNFVFAHHFDFEMLSSINFLGFDLLYFMNSLFH